ncbi:MAG TPA: hypothetical protein VEY10_10370 [Flavisolibacter sp.]|jgi:hypothetical protein|nr:hypothetical protein [Flavisolibacter sp.]
MRANYLLPVLAAILFFSCKKESEEFKTEAVSDYLLTKPGKFIVYRTDSMITNRGAAFVTRSYQEKHQADALITDNLGRSSYRIFRYLRDTTGNGPWQPSGSYFVTPLPNSVEVVENSLRFLKLAGPVRENNSWRGNRFLPADLYASYDLDANGIEDWEYNYTSTENSVTLGGKPYNNVITVDQVNEGINAPVTNFGEYGYKNYSVEQYAKGIGLIYQEFIVWQYQPTNVSRPGYRGFGVKRSIIDHN